MPGPGHFLDREGRTWHHADGRPTVGLQGKDCDMELREFVKETLVQIIKGIEDAQSETKKTGAVISPSRGKLAPDTQDKVLLSKSGGILEGVAFDVAVTASDTSEKGGGVGIFVWAVGAGVKGKSEIPNAAVSRIQFNVPVILPKGKT
ncbi:hypothetical protein LCGC14_2932880 [marine sediment metagenome]|uniref:Uncharacterized protein n=1 Tax=marine sediment metagenome TaxID=412755 RepID=A0A0F8XKV2_9ZZZZ